MRRLFVFAAALTFVVSTVDAQTIGPPPGPPALAFPGIATSVLGGTPGMDFGRCLTKLTCGWTLSQESVLQAKPGTDIYSALSLQRLPQGKGGINSDTPAALYVHSVIPSTDSYSETNAQFRIDSYATGPSGAQNLALSASAYRYGTTPGSLWGAVISSNDMSTVNNPVYGQDGLEIDTVAPDGTTDSHHARTVLKVVAGGFGGSGTHVSQGINISPYYAADTIDTGLCFGACGYGGQRLFGIGIDFAGNTFSKAAIQLSAAKGGNAIVWNDTTGAYDGLRHGMALAADMNDNFNIDNFDNTSTQLRTVGGTVMARFTSQYAQYRVLTTAQLAACTSKTQGAMVIVSDSTSRTLGSTFAGGAGNFVEAFCNGSSWTVAAALGATVAAAPASLGLSAAGTTQATATVLAAGVNEVTTVASGSGVTLAAWSGQAGQVQRVEVISAGAHALAVYPPPGAAIRNLNGSTSAGSANAPASLAIGTHATFECVSATLCYEAS